MKAFSQRSILLILLTGLACIAVVRIHGLNRRIQNIIEWVALLSLPEQGLQPAEHLLPPSRVAHAGGEWISNLNQNSLECLDNSYLLGLRIFELDFEWTNDNHLVCIHDWNESWMKRGGRSGGAPTLAAYLQTKPSNFFTPITLPILNNWLSKHQDAFIITDIKNDNLKGLRLIKQTIPTANQQVIPQIYKFSEWQTVHGLNYGRIILTLYKYGQPSFMVRRFIRSRTIWALTVPVERAKKDPIVGFARSRGVHVYAHTINANQQLKELMDLGVSEIYTDSLLNSKKSNN